MATSITISSGQNVGDVLEFNFPTPEAAPSTRPPASTYAAPAAPTTMAVDNLLPASARGKTIESIAMTRSQYDRGALHITLVDGPRLEIADVQQDCCEERFMTCDDALAEFVGATLLTAHVADAPGLPADDVHEVQFLRLYTSRGVIVVANHNIHNGFYGGFDVEIRELAG